MPDQKFKQLKYNKARLAIMKLIAESDLKVGDVLPSTRHLSATLPYGAITIRHALSEMETDGLIERRPGSGTYLAKELKDNRFSSNLLFISVAKREDNASGPGLDPLRRYLAERGIGLNVISVYEFGLDIIEAAKNSFGILLSGWLTKPFLSQMQTIGQPMVIVGNYGRNTVIPSVSLNLEEGTRRMTEILIGEGHKRIALFCGFKENYFPATLYEDGYTRAMLKAGLPLCIQKSPSLFESGRSMDHFLDKNNMPDAVLMEASRLYDFISWCWRHASSCRHPAIALLSPLSYYRKYRQSPQLRCVVYPDSNLEGAKLLLNHVIQGGKLNSKILLPYIPGVDDDEEYFIH